MAEYLIQDTTLDAIADAINAKTGGSSAMTPAEMVTAIESIPSGTTITDGIVVKSRDANGRATTIDFYGSQICIQQFYNYSKTNGAWISLENIAFKNTVTEIQNNGFRCCSALLSLPETVERIGSGGCEQIGIINATLPNLTTLQGGSTFSSCSSLQSFVAPKLTTINGNYNFGSCSALQTVQFGSIGYSLTNVPPSTFTQVRQAGLTIEVYSTGNYVDALVANIRYNATNATITIKASENTTYNGTSYAAGDTILTSEVT